MITFAYIASISNEARNANAEINKALGLPEHRGSGRLAVVGGGPSIDRHVRELQKWDGGLWAVNGAINWCLDHGIDAPFYTIDAAPIENWTYDLSRIKRAILSIDCDPSLYAALSGAEITTLPITDGGPTSANAADLFAINAGYHGGLTWFGCESSFAGSSTHAFKSFPVSAWIVVKVGGKEFQTKPEFLEQARIMSEVISTAPHFYSEKSGGLLEAMVEHGMEYELISISPEVEKILIDRHAA